MEMFPDQLKLSSSLTHPKSTFQFSKTSIYIYIYVYTYDAIGTQHKYYTVDKLTYKLGGGALFPS